VSLRIGFAASRRFGQMVDHLSIHGLGSLGAPYVGRFAFRKARP
jgi:hypothetical protein